MKDNILDAIADAGLELLPEWNTEKPVRNGSQWLIGKKLVVDGHEVSLAWFGDYKVGKRHEWNSGLNGAGKSKQIEEQVKLALEQERIAREKVWDETAERIAVEWADFSEIGSSAYLVRKQIPELFGARVAPNEHGDPILIVPLRDANGKLWNYQRIYAQKLSKGDKFFEQAARIDGCFHLLNARGESLTLDDAKLVYICEGFATAASVKMAFGAGHFVVSSFNAGNIAATAQAIREKVAGARIVICADNDAYTIIDGKERNVGIDKARRAAGQIAGEVCWPVFKYPAKGLTDFNDLHVAQGLDTVKDQIENPGKYVTGMQPMILRSKKNGQLMEPSEKELSDYLHKFLEGKIVRSDKNLFMYCGTHWVELDSMGMDKVRQWIGVAANHTLGIRDINNFYNYFFTHAPQVPKGVDLFQPNPYAANFQNGTLHVQGEELEFRKHDPTDYLTSTLPFDHPDDPAALCPRFDDMVNRLWANNTDLPQIKDLIDELIGACLCPAFPGIFFFTGRPNSGKSTIVKLLVKLLSWENVCSVQLCDMNGFNMETMVGKLVNFDTDIDINRPMNDSEVKKIIDRVPRRVRRKGRTDIARAFLPAVHLFASNGLPKSLDGSSHAYGRRLVIIQTESWTAPARADRDFEVTLLKDETPGILARGLRGIKRLLEQNGQFTIPPGSLERVAELEADSDIAGQFIEEVKHGEVYDKSTKLVLDPNSRIERKALWEHFSEWQDQSVMQGGAKLGKKQFFSRMESMGFCCTQSKGARRFVGLGVVIEAKGIA